MTPRTAIALLLLVAGCEDDRRAHDRPATQLDIAPKGYVEPAPRGRPAIPAPLILRVDLFADRVTITQTAVPPQVVERTGRTIDDVAADVERVLRTLHDGPFAGRTDLELSVAADVPYADVIAVMDHAQAAGFTDVGLVAK